MESLPGGPATLSPADYWLTFVSNQSSYGNWAIYSNPTIVNAALAFTQSSNVTYIQSLVAQAQKQVYDDAPYAWFGVTGIVDSLRLAGVEDEPDKEHAV